MKIINQKIILFFFVLLTFGFQCGEEDNNYWEYSGQLELPYEALPLKQEYKINDTIQLLSIIENGSLKDKVSQNVIEIECTDIPINLYVGVRYADHNQINSNDMFQLIIDTVNFQDYELKSNGQYSTFRADISEDIFYKEEIAVMSIIPKKTGVFMISPYNPEFITINRNENCNPINPSLERWGMNSIFLNGSNPELIEESPLPPNVISSNDKIPILTEEKRIFWFKVTN